jgi:hypothetical protein
MVRNTHQIILKGVVLNMTNTELLEQKIKESGKKISYLADKVGLSYAGLRNCVTNKAEFKAKHIDILCKELSIDLKEMKTTFFAKNGA